MDSLPTGSANNCTVQQKTNHAVQRALVERPPGPLEYISIGRCLVELGPHHGDPLGPCPCAQETDHLHEVVFGIFIDIVISALSFSLRYRTQQPPRRSL